MEAGFELLIKFYVQLWVALSKFCLMRAETLICLGLKSLLVEAFLFCNILLAQVTDWD